jgi:hypothetical protein
VADDLVIPTKERLGSYDAIETAKPGEPLFPVQGGDPFGPDTVLHWAGLCRAEGLRLAALRSRRQQERGEHLLRKATAAEQVAWAMCEYQRSEGAEAAPEPEQVAHTVEVAREREVRIRATDRLHNLTAEVAEVAEVLRGLGHEHVPTALRLEAASAVLREAAGVVEPRRGMERS